MPAILPRSKVNEAILPETASHVNDERALNDVSNKSSETSFEGSFFFGRHSLNKSDTFVHTDQHIEMPEFGVHGLEQNLTRARSIPAFLSGGNLGYRNEVYIAAAAIFERLASRKEVGEVLVQYPPVAQSAPIPEFSTPQMKRQAYELAYETLKYQELLEEIIADSGYLFSHPAGEDTSALILVMLFDFQHRRWGPRSHIIGDAAHHEVEEVEANIMDHRIHLAAALARSRVKNQSQTIDYVLPEDVRKQEKCAADLPQYAWINTMKMTIKDVLQHLEHQHYAEFLDSDFLIPPNGKFYRRDRHCDDVIIFPADQKEPLKAFDLVEKGVLILQDKTSSLAVQSVAALLTADDDCDLIHADVASGLTTAHLAVVLYRKSKEKQESKDFLFRRSISHAPSSSEAEDRLVVPKVFAFGVKSEEHKTELNTLFNKLKITNVQLFSERFETVDPKRDVMQFAKVKAVLLTPQCTRTAVANPIEFMLNEGDRESYRMLKELSHGDMHKKAVNAGLAHTETLKAALLFPDVKSVIYATRSVHSQENEQAVNNAVKWHREKSDNNSRPFRVCPPTLPLLSSDIKKDVNDQKKKQLMSTTSLKHNFLKMRQNSQMNGCFIAVLVRELDPNDAAAVKEMIRKAAFQGLIIPDKKPLDTTPKETQAVSPPIKSFTVDQHRHHSLQSKKTHKSNLKTSPSLPKANVGAPKSSSTLHLKKLPKKPVEAKEVDRLLNNYEKAQSAKTGVQRVNTLEIGIDNKGTRPPSAKVGSSLESKELEFGKNVPKGKPKKE